MTTLDAFIGKVPMSGAVISDDEIYRYRLWRTEETGEGTVVFIMLNPSTADVTNDDPTIRRCRGFARDLGYRRVEIINLFAFRSTSPKGLREVEDPVGPENDDHILEVSMKADLMIAAWGVHGTLNNRNREVLGYLDEVYCLGTTKDGHPSHPLYLKKELRPIPLKVRQ